MARTMSSLFLMLKLMKFVSISTRNGGPSAVLCLKNSSDGYWGLQGHRALGAKPATHENAGFRANAAVRPLQWHKPLRGRGVQACQTPQRTPGSTPPYACAPLLPWPFPCSLACSSRGTGEVTASVEPCEWRGK